MGTEIIAKIHNKLLDHIIHTLFRPIETDMLHVCPIENVSN